ncbi:permease [Clostridium sp. PL3]|uniref:Permease n=2 Tax=Clostridium thailandense TaxID=2794346 RepID=A0A949X4Q8_9CLOT|nr:permease [Clostridium thailandense]MBV7274383.1 permease [Clostridium thailandense]
MEKDNQYSANNRLLIVIMVTSVMLLFLINILRNMTLPKIDEDMLNNFYTIFISMILEGFPFIIIGSLIASFIQSFISEEKIVKLIPKNRIVGLILAALVGLIFPVCDCAIIPITRRLIKKKIPIGMAIAFMVSVPIVNPIVIFSTYYAFYGKPYIVLARVLFGVISAVLIGYLIDILHTGNVLKYNIQINSCRCGCSENHNHVHIDHKHKYNFLSEIIYHTSTETYSTGKLFIIGALISAFVQTYVPKRYILSIGQGSLYSILVMLLLAYVLCICSQTDAFIARAFLGQFTVGSIIGFLIFGPMLDIKNTLMLTGTFNRKFTIKLIFLIIAVCFIMAIVANYAIPISLKFSGGF